jgi:hypothetical protein
MACGRISLIENETGRADWESKPPSARRIPDWETNVPPPPNLKTVFRLLLQRVCVHKRARTAAFWKNKPAGTVGNLFKNWKVDAGSYCRRQRF